MQLVADRTIGVEPLFAAALLDGRIGGRPVLHLDGGGPREFERAMMRFRRRA